MNPVCPACKSNKAMVRVLPVKNCTANWVCSDCKRPWTISDGKHGAIGCAANMLDLKPLAYDWKDNKILEAMGI